MSYDLYNDNNIWIIFLFHVLAMSIVILYLSPQNKMRCLLPYRFLPSSNVLSCNRASARSWIKVLWKFHTIYWLTIQFLMSYGTFIFLWSRWTFQWWCFPLHLMLCYSETVFIIDHFQQNFVFLAHSCIHISWKDVNAGE